MTYSIICILRAIIDAKYLFRETFEIHLLLYSHFPGNNYLIFKEKQVVTPPFPLYREN